MSLTNRLFYSQNPSKQRLDVHNFPFNIYVSKRKRRSFCIKVESDSSVVVLAPQRSTQTQICSVIEKHERWIQKQIHTKQELSLLHKQGQCQTGKTCYLWGSPLKLVMMDGAMNSIFVSQDHLIFETKQTINEQENLKILENWYVDLAKDYLINRTKDVAERLGYNVENIRIKRLKTRWGSCSVKKNINLSYRLIMAPKTVADYVIIHELCHLTHMNHSSKFWGLVETYCPDYKAHKAWLNSHGQLLSL